MEVASRYAVGIDLGTTHCVVAYTDLTSDLPSGESPQINLLDIPQLENPGQVVTNRQLPSFAYQAHSEEINGAQPLPWTHNADALVGRIARVLGDKTPLRLVSSAKSWLSHSISDPRGANLPLNSPDDVEKLSALAATKLYLAHLKAAWNHQFSGHPLEDQQVTITLPASFDPSARELTAEAANSLNLKHLTLLEEPQAATYAWLASQNNWRDQVSVGDRLLVVDIGGGTTDLSLIEISEHDGELCLDRLAVGDHILLGGDNMDLALAYQVSNKLKAEGKKSLAGWQIQAISQACRNAKEKLLSDNDVNSVPIVIPSRGSSLLGGTLRTELNRDEVEQFLIEGFFPAVAINDHPRQAARAALSQAGLNYAQDARITSHIAAFLSSQANGNTTKPNAVLLNGGVLKAPNVVKRLLSTLNSWGDDHREVEKLEGIDLDYAVAKGAAYYGYSCANNGVRIRGGTASAYYVGIESAIPAIPGMPIPMEALCVAPMGMEEGSEVAIDSSPMTLIVGESVQFKFMGSHTRSDDLVGEMLEDWEDELTELPDINVYLDPKQFTPGQSVPVKLVSRVTELGNLQIDACALDSDARWQVEFSVRD